MPEAETSTPARSGASDVSVVVPAFNEAGSIEKVVSGLRERFPDAEVFVVDDGSTDGTGDAARRAGAQVVQHRVNRGYGASVKSGIQASRRDFVALFDGDAQHRVEDLAGLLQQRAEYDMVVGVRGPESHQSWKRRPGKWVLARVADILAGTAIPDLNSGLRVFRRAVVLKYLHLLPDGFSASTTTTLLMLKRGYRTGHVPITTAERVGTSQVRILRDGFNTLLLLIRLIVLFDPLRFFLPISLALTFVGMTYGIYKFFTAGLHQFPVGGLLVVITGVLSFFFGIIADQISEVRKALFERPDTPPTDGRTA